MKTVPRSPWIPAAFGVLFLAAVAMPQGRPPSSKGQDRLTREVRHELVMLPYYGVFDNLSYRVNGYTVELLGQVTRPTLKTDAERAVKNIEGVEKVVNNIEVLPLSPNDERLRLAVYRAIYGHPNLNRYALQAVPSIHILVKNGNVILEGVAANEGDKNIANIQAKTVPGVFSVTNNLQVEKKLQNRQACSPDLSRYP
jgi:hyperosmotically inducible protein